MRFQMLGLKRMRRLLSFCIITAALNSCSVSIKNDPLYFDEGPSGATELHFISPGQIDLTLQQWDAIREGMVCMNATSFGDFKTEIEQLCTLANCTYEDQQNIKAFFLRLSSLQRSNK